MNQNQQPNFSKLRAALWPIHGYELKKFLPMGMMMFCALFNYTINLFCEASQHIFPSGYNFFLKNKRLNITGQR